MIVMQFLKAVRVDLPKNNCASLNYLIWARCPKSTASGKTHLEAATAGTVLSFSEGRKAYKGALKVLASSKE